MRYGQVKPRYQTVNDPLPARNDHVWLKQRADRYKCCLCGGVATSEPPPYPTPESWMPDFYEELTSAERMLGLTGTGS